MMSKTVKKMVIVSLLTLAFAVQGFSEAVIAPSLGYAHSYWWLKEESRVKSKADYSIDTTYSTNAFIMGVDMMFTAKRSGFSFFFNNYVAFPGKFYYTNIEKDNKTGEVKPTKGYLAKRSVFLWDVSLLIGHRFKINQAILALGVGLGFGLGGGNNGKSVDFTMNIGTTMHFSFDYIFTKKIGLHVSMSDTIGREISNAFAPRNSWMNHFQFKVGPAFKF